MTRFERRPPPARAHTSGDHSYPLPARSFEDCLGATANSSHDQGIARSNAIDKYIAGLGAWKPLVGVQFPTSQSAAQFSAKPRHIQHGELLGQSDRGPSSIPPPPPRAPTSLERKNGVISGFLAQRVIYRAPATVVAPVAPEPMAEVHTALANDDPIVAAFNETVDPEDLADYGIDDDEESASSVIDEGQLPYLVPYVLSPAASAPAPTSIIDETTQDVTTASAPVAMDLDADLGVRPTRRAAQTTTPLVPLSIDLDDSDADFVSPSSSSSESDPCLPLQLVDEDTIEPDLPAAPEKKARAVVASEEPRKRPVWMSSSKVEETWAKAASAVASAPVVVDKQRPAATPVLFDLINAAQNEVHAHLRSGQYTPLVSACGRLGKFELRPDELAALDLHRKYFVYASPEKNPLRWALSEYVARVPKNSSMEMAIRKLWTTPHAKVVTPPSTAALKGVTIAPRFNPMHTEENTVSIVMTDDGIKEIRAFATLVDIRGLIDAMIITHKDADDVYQKIGDVISHALNTLGFEH